MRSMPGRRPPELVQQHSTHPRPSAPPVRRPIPFRSPGRRPAELVQQHSTHPRPSAPPVRRPIPFRSPGRSTAVTAQTRPRSCARRNPTRPRPSASPALPTRACSRPVGPAPRSGARRPPAAGRCSSVRVDSASPWVCVCVFLPPRGTVKKKRGGPPTDKDGCGGAGAPPPVVGARASGRARAHRLRVWVSSHDRRRGRRVALFRGKWASHEISPLFVPVQTAHRARRPPSRAGRRRVADDDTRRPRQRRRAGRHLVAAPHAHGGGAGRDVRPLLSPDPASPLPRRRPLARVHAHAARRLCRRRGDGGAGGAGRRRRWRAAIQQHGLRPAGGTPSTWRRASRRTSLCGGASSCRSRCTTPASTPTATRPRRRRTRPTGARACGSN